MKHRFPFREIRQIPRFISHHWPPIILFFITIGISFLNYEPGTYLTGWDNLHPELNFGLNIKRSIFSVWQEYQSLGLLGGMAHASDMIRQIFLAAISSVFRFPDDFIRYFWVFLMFVTGTIGSYKLISFLVEKRFDPFTRQSAAFLGALFYALNLSTVQTFFTSFETFTSFFGFLPWLTLAFFSYLNRPTFKNSVILFAVCLLSAPAFYVETIFLVFSLFLFIIFFNHLSDYRFKPKEIITTIKAVAVLGLSQIYWLLPNIFFVLTNSNVALTAKNNTIVSTETFYRNLQFGNLTDIALLKGYWFDLLFYTRGSEFDYLMSVWRQHLSEPFIIFLGYSFFCLIVAGIIFSISKKLHYSNSLVIAFLVCVFFLVGGGKLVISFPLVGELFRSPYTKFSILLSLMYAYFFSIGIIFLLDLFSFLSRRFTHHFTIYTATIALVAFSSPIFSGNFISPAFRLNIPDEYFQLFDFFNNQDKSTRIANFPQLTHWGWNYFSWGYQGSGFYWYGIKQPIIDRAFDVWSKDSEIYYEEVNKAIYSNKNKDFEALMDKYSADWIFVDRYLIATDNSDTGLDAISGFLNNSTKFTLEKNINDRLFVYRNNKDIKASNFISVTSPPSQIPLIPHLSRRPVTNWQIDKDSLTLPVNLTSSQIKSITFPSFTQTENSVLSELSYWISSSNIVFKLTPILPIINLDGNKNTLTSEPTYVYLPRSKNSGSFILNIGKYYLELEPPAELSSFEGYYPITNLYLPTKTSFDFRVFDGSSIASENLTSQLQTAEPKQCYKTKENRNIEKILERQTTSLLAKDATGCLTVNLPSSYPNALTSVFLTHSSTTKTPLSIFFSRNDQMLTAPQLLENQTAETQTKIFDYSPTYPLDLNIVVEANGSQSIQEINIRDINVTYHQLLFETQTRLENIAEKNIEIDKNTKNISISFPITNTSYNITETPLTNQLSSESINCDKLNDTFYKKEVTSDGIIYSAINANICDHLNLRFLPHDLTYLFSFDFQNIVGANTTVCLHNGSTNRCDVFERLINSPGLQSIISDISNSNESSWYTLNLFNQSFGKAPTSNILKKIHINPIPINFLEKITSTIDDNPVVQNNTVITTHPAEFVYTAIGNQESDTLINLYQSYSPYWIALQVPRSALDGNLLSYIVKLPILYLTNPKLTPYVTNASWHNSWLLPKGDYTLFIFYAPQYLQFFGFIVIILFSIFLVIKIISKVTKTKRSFPFMKLFTIKKRSP